VRPPQPVGAAVTLVIALANRREPELSTLVLDLKP
jgi:hypothetical protein